jgi:SAM-dependent methyltransferase
MNLAQREHPEGQADRILARPDAAILVHDKVLSFLRVSRAGRLLDVPAGEGAFAEQAKRLGYTVCCGDIDPSRFRANGIEFTQVDLNARWPYPSNSFDYVVSIEAVEHLENPWHLVREANRVLKNQGILFLTTPNILTIKSRLSYFLNGYPNYFHFMVNQDSSGNEYSVDHINPVSFLELRHILARNGFCVDLVEANRFLKDTSVVFKILKLLLKTRGRSHAKSSLAKAKVRDTLLSKSLLFGEVLVLKAREVLEAS